MDLEFRQVLGHHQRSEGPVEKFRLFPAHQRGGDAIDVQYFPVRAQRDQPDRGQIVELRLARPGSFELLTRLAQPAVFRLQEFGECLVAYSRRAEAVDG